MLQSQVQETFAGAMKSPAATPPSDTARQFAQDGENDPFLEHYFKRIDPSVAGSFNDEQRAAIKAMFGARGIARHSFEVRRTLPIFWRRYYLVVLMGRERRDISRLFGGGVVSFLFELAGHAITAGLCLLPLAALLVAIRTF